MKQTGNGMYHVRIVGTQKPVANEKKRAERNLQFVAHGSSPGAGRYGEIW
jgi:hypothetical protein